MAYSSVEAKSLIQDLNLSEVMENSQSTSSVIAKLMGLDEKPPQQQPVSRQQRVLSDNYLQKSGSIGKRSRTYSQNNLLGSKKRANRRTNSSDKDIMSRCVKQKNLSSTGMQGFKSSIDFDSENNRENAKSGTVLPRKMIFLKPNLANIQQSSRPAFLLDSETTFAWEAKKQLLEKLKMTVSQERRSMFSLKVSKSMSRSNFGSSIVISREESRKRESGTKLPILKRLNFSSLTKKSVKTTSDVNPKSGQLVNIIRTVTKKNHLVSNPSKDVESFHGDIREGCSSHLSDISSEQDSMIKSHEDGLVSSNCKEEHSNGKVEAYQYSPNSVLEPPFREDNSSSSEYCESSSNDLHDLWMEDDFGPEMVTSSDDERSCSGQTLRSTTPFGVKESRDFSYLVDVLDESGFPDSNVEINFEKWHSSECMASESIFETLEKKYGKQELWHKSERKLLFDRINSGMIEIVRPRIDIRVCPNPLQRKVRNMSRRDVIEEELSVILLGQEKGIDDGVSEKAVGRDPWFDPADELDSLVTEIEIFLFDELTAELVNV
ncbi:hypothetical protein L2E82_32316 [Cichorium intybus]|uniref:Uncharacterized protein n=1 Tax=Cichorium intybus TaxID=13427 RepID=A0ACB9BFZ2_CICIN|nr:hypothetical protein L2E82_32316 [Cichorium intybus]